MNIDLGKVIKEKEECGKLLVKWGKNKIPECIIDKYTGRIEIYERILRGEYQIKWIEQE